MGTFQSCCPFRQLVDLEFLGLEYLERIAQRRIIAVQAVLVRIAAFAVEALVRLAHAVAAALALQAWFHIVQWCSSAIGCKHEDVDYGFANASLLTHVHGSCALVCCLVQRWCELGSCCFARP
eukprot:s1182_g30.t1